MPKMGLVSFQPGMMVLCGWCWLLLKLPLKQGISISIYRLGAFDPHGFL